MTMREQQSVAEMLAEFQQKRGAATPNKAVAVIPATNPAIAIHEALPTASHTITHIPLDRIVINVRQPRRYLPADLRHNFADGNQTAEASLRELCERAGAGDVEAQGYLVSLTELANSIADIGLEQPIKVIASLRGGQQVYEIKDGERRFWAHVLLAQQDPTAPPILAAMIEPEAEGASSDDLLKIQWQVNVQREDIPVIDFAVFVRDQYRAAFDHVAADRDAAIAQLELSDAQGWRDSEIAIALTVRAVRKQTSKRLGRRTVFLLVQIADKLSDPAKALARAHGLSLRDLARLAKVSPEQQQQFGTALASQTLALRVGSEATTVESPAKKKRGRPTLAQRELNLCRRLAEHLTQRNPKQLMRLGAPDLQMILSAVNDAREALGDYEQLVKSVLTRAGTPAREEGGD